MRQPPATIGQTYAKCAAILQQAERDNEIGDILANILCFTG
jgi:hypothetical protein